MSDEEEFFDFEDEPEDRFHDAAESKLHAVVCFSFVQVSVADTMYDCGFYTAVSICWMFVQVEQTPNPVPHMPLGWMQLLNILLMRAPLSFASTCY